MSLDFSKKVWLIYAMAFAVAALSLAAMPWWTVDDAFISYRYGRNLLEFGQLTWNPGETPFVEGYTGILLPLLAAGILWVGLPLIGTLKVLGLFAMVFTVWRCRKALQDWGASPLLQGLAVLFLAATPLLYMHSLSGLETIFFTCFVTTAILETVPLDPDSGNTGRLSWALLLAGLTRPEGILLAGLVFLHQFYWIVKQGFGKSNVKQWMMSSIPVLALTAYWIWRTCYYGSLLPNSYHAKQYHGWLNPDSAFAFIKFFGYYCFLPLVIAIGLRFRAGRNQNPSPAKTAQRIALTFAAICLGTYLHSSLWMNYGSRFFFPWLPIFVVLVFAAIHAATKEGPQAAGWSIVPRMQKLLIYMLVGFQLAILGFRYVQELTFLRYYHKIVSEELIAAGEYIGARLPKDAVVISYMDAGALGYFGKTKVVDFGRLNDVYLAQNQLSESDVIKYFYDQDADALLLTSESKDSLSYIPELMAIASNPRFKNYRLEKVWHNTANYPYWQRLYFRIQR